VDIKFLEFREGKNWVRGNVNNGEYTFSSKLFDQGSIFGIDDGRVSKLIIFKGERQQKGLGNVFVFYDRGWDIEPQTKEEQNIYEHVLEFLENAPKNRF